MTRAGASLFYFGIYVLLLSFVFIALPEKIIALAKLPSLTEGWARIIGFLALIIAVCDIVCGKHNVLVMIRASVYTRLAFFAGIILLVVFHQMPFTAIFFGAMDALCAIWTAVSLKAAQKNT